MAANSSPSRAEKCAFTSTRTECENCREMLQKTDSAHHLESSTSGSESTSSRKNVKEHCEQDENQLQERVHTHHENERKVPGIQRQDGIDLLLLLLLPVAVVVVVLTVT